MQMAAQDRILAATEDDRVVGYVLFDLPRRDVRIVQLCVDEDQRGRGIARKLVEELSRRYQDRLGLRLRCRRDWDANDAWPRLGFRPAGEVPGRGKERKPLTVWWKEHPHPTLFSSVDEPLLVVAMDADVFSAIYGGYQAVDSEALALAPDSPLMADDLEMVSTPELAREINATTDERVRKRLLASLSGLRSLDAQPEEIRRAAQALLDLVSDEALNADPSLASDAREIAAAHVGGASAYVSNDGNAMTHLAPAADQLWGFRVLRPVDVLLHARELRPETRYAPAALANTTFVVSEVATTDRKDLDTFLDNAGGERRGSWNSRFAVSVASSLATGGMHLVVRDGNRTPVGLLIARRENQELIATVLRVARHHLAGSIARQLAAQLRDRALTLGCELVVVDDPHVGELGLAALDQEGFVPQGKQLRCHIWNKVMSANSELATRLGLPEARTAEEWAILEHRGWPLKVRGSEIPSVIIPIRPQFAADLLDLDILTSRATALGLSREHVYYRAPVGRVPAPGRILWYASAPVKAVVACSRVIDVVRGAPDDLHRANARLGVWSRATVRDRAHHGQVQAIRFGDTERLSPINFERLADLAQSDRLGTLQTVTPISEAAFMNIYEAGR